VVGVLLEINVDADEPAAMHETRLAFMTAT